MTEMVVKPGGTPTWTRDAALNDSDKSFAVGTAKCRELRYVRAVLVATATVGNRILSVEINDGTNVLWQKWIGTNITASQTGVFEIIFGSNSDEFAGDVTIPANNVTRLAAGPACCLPSGYAVRVYDTAAIDAAADDLTVVLHYIEYDV